ncbi:MAG: hypothetical protein V1244_06835, partial [Nitrospinaceae bacterium]|nr:hypothetical protein [Nitrospinaceae bacterium]
MPEIIAVAHRKQVRVAVAVYINGYKGTGGIAGNLERIIEIKAIAVSPEDQARQLSGKLRRIGGYQQIQVPVVV